MPRPYLLFFNPIYWVVTWLRNAFYDMGLLKSTYFHHPIIALGNLSTGGTGKTPHTEYLIDYVQETHQPAVLSRGYRRKTTGFVLANQNSTANEIGDEPCQIKQKFPNIQVAVDADRVHGVNQLLALKEPPSVILLDDAFQHRKLQAGFYILLTPFNHLFVNDTILPAGNLREPKSGADRAHIIIVTKCPLGLSEEEMATIKKMLKPKAHQRVFFSRINYADYKGDEFDMKNPFILVTGIANVQPLVSHLKEQNLLFEHLNFPDHHHFSEHEIEHMTQQAKKLREPVVLTTEKDFQRLPLERFKKAGIKVAYLPIKIQFLSDEANFQSLIESYISGYSA